jgi:hypothetical protein
MYSIEAQRLRQENKIRVYRIARLSFLGGRCLLRRQRHETPRFSHQQKFTRGGSARLLESITHEMLSANQVHRTRREGLLRYLVQFQLRKPGGQRAGREDVEDVRAEREHIGKIIRDRRVRR